MSNIRNDATERPQLILHPFLHTPYGFSKQTQCEILLLLETFLDSTHGNRLEGAQPAPQGQDPADIPCTFQCDLHKAAGPPPAHGKNGNTRLLLPH